MNHLHKLLATWLEPRKPLLLSPAVLMDEQKLQLWDWKLLHCVHMWPLSDMTINFGITSTRRLQLLPAASLSFRHSWQPLCRMDFSPQTEDFQSTRTIHLLLIPGSLHTLSQDGLCSGRLCCLRRLLALLFPLPWHCGPRQLCSYFTRWSQSLLTGNIRRTLLLDFSPFWLLSGASLAFAWCLAPSLQPFGELQMIVLIPSPISPTVQEFPMIASLNREVLPLLLSPLFFWQ